MKQVNKDHYSFEKYTKLSRWISYWNQITEVLKLNPKTVLIVGPGDGVVKEVLKTYVDTVHTLDIAQDLNPDLVGSVSEVHTLIKEKYDVIICCQVLEHLPYSEFDKTLKSLKQSCNQLVLSLPYANINVVEFFFRLPRKISFYFNIVVPKFFKTWKFDGEHHWEIGSNGYRKSKIKNDISKHFKIQKDFHVKFNKYHIFYICESL